jgi:hypothetical protein
MPKAYMVVTYRSVSNPEALAARAVYEGPAYAEALKALGKNAAVRDMRLVEGAE